MRAPSAGVPLPGGRPVPSGRMLMFQAAISAGVSDFPRFGVCAKASLVLRTSVSTTMYPPSLRVYMLHLPAAPDRPTRDGIVVLARKCGDGWSPSGLAAHSHELGSRRLHVAGLVPRTTLQYSSTAVPPPRQAESRESPALHRLLQCRLR